MPAAFELQNALRILHGLGYYKHKLKQLIKTLICINLVKNNLVVCEMAEPLCDFERPVVLKLQGEHLAASTSVYVEYNSNIRLA